MPHARNSTVVSLFVCAAICGGCSKSEKGGLPDCGSVVDPEEAVNKSLRACEKEDVEAISILADDVARAKAEDDITETTFRYQFLHNASGLQRKARVYFLSIGENGNDPSDEFMKRFADHEPAVRKRSQSKGGMVGVAPEFGLIFRVEKIKWISDTEVEVEGGYYEAGASSSVNTYYLKKERAKWVVTKDVMHAIS